VANDSDFIRRVAASNRQISARSQSAVNRWADQLVQNMKPCASCGTEYDHRRDACPFCGDER
jgi:hypothetical protein